MKSNILLGVIVVVCLSLVFAIPCAAQNTKQDVKNARQAVQDDKRAVVTANMEFTEAEASAFWPLYDEYQKEILKLGDRTTEVIKNYGKVRKVMNNDAAASLLDKYLAIDRDRVKLQEDYVPKFNKVMPMTKVFRYYQIENKYRFALDTSISEQIPLVEP